MCPKLKLYREIPESKETYSVEVFSLHSHLNGLSKIRKFAIKDGENCQNYGCFALWGRKNEFIKKV